MGTIIEGFVDLPTWDLSDLYANSKDPKIDQDLILIEKQVDDFVSLYTAAVFEGRTIHQTLIRLRQNKNGKIVSV